MPQSVAPKIDLSTPFERTFPITFEPIDLTTPVDDLRTEVGSAIYITGDTLIAPTLELDDDEVTTETLEENTYLALYRKQFNTLSSGARRGLNWQAVLDAVDSVDSLSQSIANLDNAQIFEVDEKHNLVFCDGGADVPNSTLGKSYLECLNEAELEGLELLSEAEYCRLQGQASCKYEMNKLTYLKSGINPSVANVACWSNNHVLVSEISTDHENMLRGARRLLRVPLNILKFCT